MERVAGRRNQVEAFIEGLGFIVFRVNRNSPNTGDVRRLPSAKHSVPEQPATDLLPCHEVATARRASSMMGTGWRARPWVSRSGASLYSTWSRLRFGSACFRYLQNRDREKRPPTAATPKNA